MPNSDWWVAELDAPQQLFALEFVVADPDTGVVDNNQCVHVLSLCILLVVYHRMLTSARRHLKAARAGETVDVWASRCSA